MEFNLETSHYLELEFKLSRAIVLCLRLWFKVGNKCRGCNYFTSVRVDLNKKLICFHLGPLSYSFYFCVCLSRVLFVLCHYSWFCCDVHGIGVSYGVFHGNVCLLLKVSFVHCNGCGVIWALLMKFFKCWYNINWVCL